MKLLLNPVRMMDHDEAREFALGDVDSMEEELAIAFINPKDFDEMYLTPSLKLHVSNDHGEITVRFKQNEDVPVGTILIPVSIWSNQLTGIRNEELINKNIQVEVEASRDPPTKLLDLIEKIRS